MFTFRRIGISLGIGVCILVLMLMCSGCGEFKFGVEDNQATQAAETLLEMIHSEQTTQANLSTPTTSIATITEIPTPESTATLPGPLKVKVFLILVDDNGQLGKLVGCGDSVVPVEIEIPYTKAVLRTTLEELITLEESYYQTLGLYSALSLSRLQIDDVLIRNGEAVVNLSGEFILGGVCDNPRVIAQLEETVLQFSTVTRVTIYINGVPLNEILSLEG